MIIGIGSDLSDIRRIAIVQSCLTKIREITHWFPSNNMELLIAPTR